MMKKHRLAHCLLALSTSTLFSVILHAQESLPVVDFGDNLFWYNTGIPQYRSGIAGVTREKLAEGEYLNGHPFSMDIPLSPVTGDYNTRGNNTRFYGGMKTHCWDNATNKYTWSEGGNNVDHEGFDDFNYMGFALESLHTPEQPGNRLVATGVWLWKKEDFLNGGDKYPVTFDETSRVGIYLSRTYPVNEEHAARLIAEGKVPPGTKPFNDTYANQRLETVPREHWKGWETVHLVVRDGEQFWVAEPAFEPVKQTLIEVSPTKVRWANYDPKGPWDFDFDHTKATFEAHTFTDVTAVGWMIVKNEPTNAGLWCKWYGFGMDAVVNRPWEASCNLPMIKLVGGDKKEGLYMAATEVPYSTYRKIARWATRNQWAMHSGLDFDRDGNMGSMLVDNKPHSAEEPATGMTWHDAILWCNALSIYEGLEPCYYADAKFEDPLLIGRFRNSPDKAFVPPPVWVKWDAPGYRLPTPEEWILAWEENQVASIGDSTLAVRAPPANTRGFHGMEGNVREFIWDIPGDCAEGADLRTVLGGDYRGVSSEIAPGGEVPSRGHHAIGFRPVRTVGSPKQPTLVALNAKPGFWKFKAIPAWTFEPEARFGENTRPQLPDIPLIEANGLAAGKTEVTYAQWASVFRWAEAHGYRFANDGDMGSMGWLPDSHSPDEPVTGISLLDAAVWCNALSELKGLKPVYYSDNALSQPLKSANPFRTISRQWTLQSNRFGVTPRPFEKFLFQVDPSADGFRLPTSTEWTALADGGKYPSGDSLDPDTAWFADTSGERTHPVATARPTGAGFHDLSGNVFEWTIEPLKDPKPNHHFSVAAHGGSFRSDTKTPGAPLGTAPSRGAWEWISSGWTSPEIGFRIVKRAP